MVSPACCFRPRTYVILLSICDILFSLFAAIVSIGSIVMFEEYKNLVIKFIREPEPTLDNFLNLKNLSVLSIRIFLAFNAFYWIQKLGLSVLLLTAAIQENREKCRLWFIYTIGLLIFSVFAFLASITLEVVQPLSIAIFVAAFIIREYVVWSVFYWMKHDMHEEGRRIDLMRNSKLVYKL